jgi:hypothetical protein
MKVGCPQAIRAVGFLFPQFFGGVCLSLDRRLHVSFGVRKRPLGVSTSKCLTVLPWYFL